jgi:transcriptional regulator of acetoin/glycerol metabolism
VERASLLARGTEIDLADLGLSRTSAAASVDRQRTLDDVEREAIRAALAEHGGNVVQAARALGVSRSALYRRIERYGL